jgi:phage terminase Nu1 subunit (DNA packaging protein)
MPEPPQTPQLVTLSQLAAICGFELRTVRRWIKSGWLNGERGLLKFPNAWRVDLTVFYAHTRATGVSQLELPLRNRPGLRLVKAPKLRAEQS